MELEIHRPGALRSLLPQAGSPFHVCGRFQIDFTLSVSFVNWRVGSLFEALSTHFLKSYIALSVLIAGSAYMVWDATF